MTRLQKAGLATVLGLLGIWGTTALGFWQVRRGAGKEVLQQQIEAAARATPERLTASELQRPAGLVHRHLRLHGRWLPDRVVYLDNRPQAGQAGFYVLMPLRIEQPFEADIIVNRGWTPRNMNDRTRIASYRTADDVVEITGVALAEEPRLLDLVKPAERTLKGIWQNFDFDAYARASGTRPVPIVVRQDREVDPARGSPTDDGLSREWPDRGGALQAQIDRHHGYAFQWFALAATLAALLLFQLYRLIRHDRPRTP